MELPPWFAYVMACFQFVSSYYLSLVCKLSIYDNNIHIHLQANASSHVIINSFNPVEESKRGRGVR